jgi:hypothetical protein
MPAREFFQEKNGRTKIELRERGLLKQARAPPARFREQAPVIDLQAERPGNESEEQPYQPFSPRAAWSA